MATPPETTDPTLGLIMGMMNIAASMAEPDTLNVHKTYKTEEEHEEGVAKVVDAIRSTVVLQRQLPLAIRESALDAYEAQCKAVRDEITNEKRRKFDRDQAKMAEQVKAKMDELKEEMTQD